MSSQTSKLLKYIDKDVVVTCVHGDKTDIESGKLEEVDPKNQINLSKGKGCNVRIPFLGYFSAVQKIVDDENGKILYINQQVKNSYNAYNEDYAHIREECGFTPLKPLGLKQS